MRIDRSRCLPADEVTTRHGIPVTTPARTVLELAAALKADHLHRLLDQVEIRRLCRDHGLPRPDVNHTIEGRQVDFLFEADKLIVETDSGRDHRTRSAFEQDRARDAIHARAGYRTLRFTDHHLTTETHTVARAVRKILQT